MAKETNLADLLGKMVGTGGDRFLKASTDPVSGKFSHILIGPDVSGTLTSLKIMGVDVMTQRGYDLNGGTLPAGYLICAGGEDYITEITLVSGTGSAIIFSQAQEG